MSPSLVVSMLAYLFLAIVAIIPLVDGWEGFGKIKRFWIIFFAFGFVVFGIWDVSNRFFENEKSTKQITNIIDTTSKTIQAQTSTSTGQIIDTLNKINATVKSRGTGINEGDGSKPLYAYLRLKPAEIPNPNMEKDPHGDSIILSYATSNYGTGNAYKIVSSDFFVNIKNGIIIPQKKINILKSNPSYIIYADSKEYYSNKEGIIYSRNYSDSTFWCLKIDYDDDSKKRKSFIKIFHADIKNQILTEAPEDVFKKIKKYLIQKNIWREPFRQ